MFFKPTIEYKQYKILDLIDKNPNITQRKISKEVNISVSMTNVYIDHHEKNGNIIKNYLSSKMIRYELTKAGVEKLRLLSIQFLRASQQVFSGAKTNIHIFLNEITSKGHQNIVLYGAGEVTEIFLQVIKTDFREQLKVVAVIDDDIHKQGTMIVNTKIISLLDLEFLKYDAILVSSYTNRLEITNSLQKVNIEREKILGFFN